MQVLTKSGNVQQMVVPSKAHPTTVDGATSLGSSGGDSAD